ncbi:MAG: hypothetical protein HY901_19135, partial [Deltaproteobacteria bacterium]|nr:hypothetical protein [Deltaproteobacteria bacterium]
RRRALQEALEALRTSAQRSMQSGENSMEAMKVWQAVGDAIELLGSAEKKAAKP